MSLIRKYHRGAAVILLAVYTFIATPVRLWHHHPHTEQHSYVENINGTGQKAIVKTTDPADHCPICNHKYSVYTELGFSQIHPLRIIYTGDEPELCCSLFQTTCFHFSNKSPPVRA